MNLKRYFNNSHFPNRKRSSLHFHGFLEILNRKISHFPIEIHQNQGKRRKMTKTSLCLDDALENTPQVRKFFKIFFIFSFFSFVFFSDPMFVETVRTRCGKIANLYGSSTRSFVAFANCAGKILKIIPFSSEYGFFVFRPKSLFPCNSWERS